MKGEIVINTKIKFGIIGLGLRGSVIGKTMMKDKRFEISAVCDPKKDTHELFLQNGISCFTNYNDMLDANIIDSVFIGTPDDTHLEVLKACVAKNINIICEKPLEVLEEKVLEMKELLKDYPKVFQVGYVLRYAPLYIKAKELVMEGKIGKIILANCIDNIHYGSYAYFHDWHRKRENVYSLLLQKTSHSLDILNWIIDSDPKQVFAYGGLDVFGSSGIENPFKEDVSNDMVCKNCSHEQTCTESLLNRKRIKNINWNENWPDYCVFAKEINVDDNQSLLVQYENGAKATYLLSQFSPYYMREFVFIGSKGTLRFDDKSNSIIITYTANNNVETFFVDGSFSSHSGGDTGLLNDFAECVMTGKTPIANYKSSFTATIACIRAQQSIDENRIKNI